MQDHRTAADHDDVARHPSATHIMCSGGCCSNSSPIRLRTATRSTTSRPPLANPAGTSKPPLAALGVCGLAERWEQTVHASKAARRFDELWPTV